MSPAARPGRWRRQLNKWLVQAQNSFLRNERVLGHPFQLTLETGNHCNLRCPLCPTPTRDQLPSGMLTATRARAILDRFPYTMHVVLSNWGEPLLNRELFEIIEQTRARGITIRMESNLTLLREGDEERLVRSGLETLVVALDGLSQESYERYRVGGRVEDVLRNVERIRAAQERHQDHRTTLEWKMVVNRYNEHELEAARHRARELGMTFNPVTIWVPEGEEHWLPQRTPTSGERTSSGSPARCHNLWQSVSVNFNGDVFPCCSEFAPEDRLSNALEGPFDVWNSPDYRARRRRNQGPVDCSGCHRNRSTEWYKTWIGASGESQGETTDH